MLYDSKLLALETMRTIQLISTVSLIIINLSNQNTEKILQFINRKINKYRRVLNSDYIKIAIKSTNVC